MPIYYQEIKNNVYISAIYIDVNTLTLKSLI